MYHLKEIQVFLCGFASARQIVVPHWLSLFSCASSQVTQLNWLSRLQLFIYRERLGPQGDRSQHKIRSTSQVHQIPSKTDVSALLPQALHRICTQHEKILVQNFSLCCKARALGQYSRLSQRYGVFRTKHIHLERKLIEITVHICMQTTNRKEKDFTVAVFYFTCMDDTATR